MTLPSLQQKALNLVLSIMQALRGLQQPDEARLNAALHIVEEQLANSVAQEKIMTALLRASLKTEYAGGNLRHVFEALLKAFVSGGFDVAYGSLQATPWNVPDTDNPGVFDFSMLECSCFTLYLAICDYLTKTFGEDGERLAHSLAVCQSGALAPTRQPWHYLDFHQKNYVIQGADRIIADELARMDINPFKDVKIMEIGGAGKSYAAYYTLIGLFTAYDNVNDNSGGYAAGAIPATPREGGAISLSNFSLVTAYDYVVTSNALSHCAIGAKAMPVAEKLHHAGDLFPYAPMTLNRAASCTA